MLKLFKLALEEIVAEEPVGTGSIDVSEAVANAEELARTDVEIQQDIQAVEELMEEKQVLEEQVNVNDQLLNNPDAVVTAADVEVSEECRNEVYYSLGYKSDIKRIKFSTESQLNEIRSNPRKYLTISNESIKDTIKKIWEKIRAFFKKIVDKIKSVFTKKREEEITKKAANLKFIAKSLNRTEKVEISDEYLTEMYNKNPLLTGIVCYCSGIAIREVLDVRSYIDEIMHLDQTVKLPISMYVDSTKKSYSTMTKERLLEYISINLDSFNTINPFYGILSNPYVKDFITEQTDIQHDIYAILAATKTHITYIRSDYKELDFKDMVCKAYFKPDFKILRHSFRICASIENISQCLQENYLTKSGSFMEINSLLNERTKLIDQFINCLKNPTKDTDKENAGEILDLITSFTDNNTIGSHTLLLDIVASLNYFRIEALNLFDHILKNATIKQNS